MGGTRSLLALVLGPTVQWMSGCGDGSSDHHPAGPPPGALGRAARWPGPRCLAESRGRPPWGMLMDLLERGQGAASASQAQLPRPACRVASLCPDHGRQRAGKGHARRLAVRAWGPGKGLSSPGPGGEGADVCAASRAVRTKAARWVESHLGLPDPLAVSSGGAWQALGPPSPSWGRRGGG